MGQSVLITGGSGFIGKALTKSLLAKGFAVRITSRYDKPAQNGVEYVKTDYHDEKSLLSALKGVAHVYHLAGTLFAYPKGEYYQTNHLATQNLVNACNKTASVERFVMVSSQAAGGPSPKGGLRTEDMPENPVSHYGKSKLLGEKTLEALNKNIIWCVLRPGIVYGKGDRGIDTFASWVKKGLIVTPGKKSTKFSFVYVDDLVDSLCLATTLKNVNGQKYFICEKENYEYKDFMDFLADALAKKPPFLISVPKFIAVFSGHISAIGSKLMGKPPVVSPDKVKEGYAGDWAVSNKKWETASGKTEWVPLKRGLALTYKGNI